MESFFNPAKVKIHSKYIPQHKVHYPQPKFRIGSLITTLKNCNITQKEKVQKK